MNEACCRHDAAYDGIAGNRKYIPGAGSVAVTVADRSFVRELHAIRQEATGWRRSDRAKVCLMESYFRIKSALDSVTQIPRCRLSRLYGRRIPGQTDLVSG